MRRWNVLTFASLAGACALLAACHDSTAPLVSKTVTLDTLLAEFGTAQSFGAGAMMMGGGLPGLGTPVPSGCTYTSSSASFVCPSTTTGGLTISRSYQLLDASNTPQSAYSPTTTAAIRMVSDLSGTLVEPGGGMTIELTSHDDHTLSGLLTGIHVMNGTGHATETMTSATGVITLTMDETTTDLVLPKPGSGSRWPQSGSIAMKISEGTGGTTLEMTMTFNGTSTVTMVLTTGGRTQTCTFDLQNPSVMPACH